MEKIQLMQIKLKNVLVCNHYIANGTKIKEIFFWYLSTNFPSSSDRKASACNAGDPGLIPSWENLLE